jgi:TM2 domain-containing membrane protein YozV
MKKSVRSLGSKASDEGGKMKVNYRAALLSAFVLPGLGQIYKGDKVKGLLLIILVNVFLLAAVYMILKYAVPLMLTPGTDGKVDARLIIERLHKERPAIRALLSSFCALWLYGWIDAAVGKSGGE